MGIRKFAIAFDNPTGCYHAGSNLAGSVLLTTDKKLKLEGLRIKFKGQAHVKLRRIDSDGEIFNYSASEVYICKQFYLIVDIELPAGYYVYPFNIQLPSQLPDSFEGKFGHIRYKTVVTLERAWKVDEKIKKLFQIASQLDLNYLALAKQPVKMIQEELLSSCCTSGFLTILVYLPQTGYVSGQDIPITIEVDNASRIAVESIYLKLSEVLEWKLKESNRETRTETRVLNRMLVEGVGVNVSKSLAQNFHIPQIQFVNLDSCSIININYYLKVTANVESVCNGNISTVIPIIMGTSPLCN